jgi:PDZ domain
VKQIARVWLRSKEPSTGAQSDSKALVKHFHRFFVSWCLAIENSGEMTFHVVEPTSFQQCLPISADPYFQLRQSDVASTSERAISFSIMNSHSAEDYVNTASHVGKTVLVLPGDPLLIETIEILRKELIHVEHMDRPMEYLVAGYVPHVSESLPSIFSRICGQGTFYLIPIVNQKQLQYLLKQSSLDQDISINNICGVEDDAVCRLPGVSKLSVAELLRRLKESDQIRDAISREVCKRAQTTSLQECHQLEMDALQEDRSEITSSERDLHDPFVSSPDMNARCCEESHHDLTAFGATLIQSLTTTQNPTIAEMMRASVDKNLGKVTKNMMQTIDENASSFVSLPLAFTDGRCTIVYTDLLFDHLEEKTTFEDNIKLIPPLGQNVGQFSIQPLRLGWGKVGWGLELVCWTNEDVVRVGRVLPNSPAWNAGARTGDILVSINGVDPTKITSSSEFACTMLVINVGMDEHLSSIEAMQSLSREQISEIKTTERGPPLVLSRLLCNGVPPERRVSDMKRCENPGVEFSCNLDPIHVDLEGSEFESNVIHDVIIQSENEHLPSSKKQKTPTGLHTQIGHGAVDSQEMTHTLRNPLVANHIQQGNFPPVESLSSITVYRSDDPEFSRNIDVIMSRPFGRSTLLSGSDFYQPGLSGTSLTLLETSLLLVSIHLSVMLQF